MTSVRVKQLEELEGRSTKTALRDDSKEDCMQQRNTGMAVTVAFVAATIALAEPKGPTVSVKGEVVDMWCYMESGEHGPSHKACAMACVKGGNPIGIVDLKGDIYIAAGLQD